MLPADKLTDDDAAFMKLALKEAEAAFREDEIPIGAVVTCGGRVVSRAHNLTQALRDCTAHAEMLAVTAAEDFLGGKYLTECTLYVTIEPCVMCAGVLYWAKLKRVVYGAADDKYGYTLMAPKALHPKTIVEGGFMAEECAALMKRFFKQKRNT